MLPSPERSLPQLSQPLLCGPHLLLQLSEIRFHFGDLLLPGSVTAPGLAAPAAATPTAVALFLGVFTSVLTTHAVHPFFKPKQLQPPSPLSRSEGMMLNPRRRQPPEP